MKPSGELEGRALTWAFPGEPQPVFAGLDLRIEPAERVAITGRSGCGKTTLLHLLAGIMCPDAGSITFDGQMLSELDVDARADIRLRRFGFVFQFADLLPELSARENVELIGRLQRRGLDRQRVNQLLDALDIADVAHRHPTELSGGQRQRVAIARAMVHRPDVIFADEPTGALDSDTADDVMKLFLDLSAESGTTLVVVTHDDRVAERLDRRVSLDSIAASSDRGAIL